MKIILDYGGADQLTSQDGDMEIDFMVSGDVGGLDMPDVQSSTFQKYGFDGEFLSTNFYGGRSLGFPITVVGSSAADYLSNRKLLFKALGIARDSKQAAVTKTIYFQLNDGTEYVAEYVLGRCDLPHSNVTYATGQLILFCPDASLKSTPAVSTQITLREGGGLTIPFTIPFDILPQQGGDATIINSGDMIYYPAITLSGPATSPTISNSTTGERIQFASIGLGTGETLTIDMKNRTIKKGTQNYMSFKVAGSEFWGLAPGSNIITFTDTAYDARASVSVEARSAYSGV